MESKPELVFNLLEEFNGIVTYDQHVVAFLELMRAPYTGCNPRGLLLSRDKVLCKQLLAFHRIPTPQFAVFRRGQRFAVPRRLRPAAVREIRHRGRLARHRPGLGGGRHRQAARARAVHARADRLRRAGRGVHRGPRAVRRRARQRAADAAAGVGDALRLDARVAAGDRHPQGEMGSRLSEALRHHHARRRGAAAARCCTSSTGCRAASIARCTCPAMPASISACASDGSVFMLEANRQSQSDRARKTSPNRRAPPAWSIGSCSSAS